MGASGELRPINLGLGSSFWIGGRIGAPVTPLDDDIGRGEFFVGLIPEKGTPWALCRGEEWTGVAEENDDCCPGPAPKDEDAPRLAKSGRGA